MIRWLGGMMEYLPENVSSYGADIDGLFYLIYWITAAVFVLVHVLLVAFMIRYQRQDGRAAVYTHGSASLEITWTIVPALIVIALAILSKPTWDHVKRELPPGNTDVRVTAKQFNWEILYPGPNGKFDTPADESGAKGDDLMLENDLHVPVNAVVHVALHSRDVIHSFFVPSFRLKQDALPGREIMAWFQVTKPGRYELPCAELCGFGHSGMKGWITVQTPQEYEAWVKSQWPNAATAQSALAPAPRG
jgi:cytochrome c oxidase subunit 2